MLGRTTLKELLGEAGLIDPATVGSADERARRRRVSLAVQLLEDHTLDAVALLDFLRQHVEVPEVELGRMVVEEDAVREVAHDLAERRCLLPLSLERHVGRSVIRVAMADPLDQSALEEIEYSTGCRVEPALGLASEIAGAVAKHYRGIVTKLIPRIPAPGQRRDDAPEGVATTGGMRTEPSHRLEDEASCELKVRALVNVLARRGLLGEDEFVEEIRDLLKQRVPDE
jgi:hypothetical protein